MKKPIWMTILAFGTLLVGSCTAQTAQTPQTPQSSIPSDVTAPEPTKKTSPIITAAINADVRSLGRKGIPSTNPDVRRKQVEAGGRDPFAPVLVQPEMISQPQTSTPTPPEKDKIDTNQGPKERNPQREVKTDPDEMIVTKVITSDRAAPVRDPEAERAPVKGSVKLPKMPPLPAIEIARLPILTTPSLAPEQRSTATAIAPGTPATQIATAVKVSGVIELGSGKKALVQVPGSKAQRYVAEGEWLSNRKVQVKRIEYNDIGTPVVILSENGQEVVKMVGSSSNTIAGNFGWTN